MKFNYSLEEHKQYDSEWEHHSSVFALTIYLPALPTKLHELINLAGFEKLCSIEESYSEDERTYVLFYGEYHSKQACQLILNKIEGILQQTGSLK